MVLQVEAGKTTATTREILSRIQFINAVTQLDPASSYVHGACLVFRDPLGNKAVVEETPVSTQENNAAFIGRTFSGSTVKPQKGLIGIEPFSSKKSFLSEAFDSPVFPLFESFLKLLFGFQVIVILM